MNEDDTFRKLRRAPYKEAEKIYMSMVEGEEWIDMLEKAGWTVEEIAVEFLHVNGFGNSDGV